MAMTVAQLARHEARLGWRDIVWMFTGGKRRRGIRMLIGFAVFVLFLHWFSYVILTHGMQVHAANDAQMLVVVTASLLLSWMLMISQAMESITRGFYTRGDLDLILSSPVSPSRVFALRVAVNAVIVSFMSILLIGPALNVLALTDNVRWFAGYGVALALGLAATAIAVALTVALFHLAGPKRTRFIAQIFAAIIGAAFVIGIQVAAILTSGTLSRGVVLRSPWLLQHAPALTHWFWIPAHALMGDMTALAEILGVSVLFYIAVTLPLVHRFAQYATAAAGVPQARARRRPRTDFVTLRPMQALRRKEWLLIRRDPWLVSQTLMQLLYLLPPALLLWRDFSDAGNGLLVLVPVLVMAGGQLAGGLAWITISGEDAPDLIRTSPLSARQTTLAKLQAVLRATATIFAPFLLLLFLASWRAALVAAVGISVTSLSTISIQLWFRTQSRRSSFRRRHTASRIATFAEAFCCIGWAATAALVAAQSWFAIATACFAGVILVTVRWLRPNKHAW
jgi:ABC-2 type transport system permease protein